MRARARQRTADGAAYRIRPVTRADAALEREFILHLSPAARQTRFMQAWAEPPAGLIRALVDVDGQQRQAFAAVIEEQGRERMIGVAQYAADASGRDCEFAVAVADDWQCRGVGSALMETLFAAAARAGFRHIYGTILADNAPMIDLARHLDLEVKYPGDDPTTVRAVRDLRPSRAGGGAPASP